MMLLSWNVQDSLITDGIAFETLADGSKVVLWAKGYFFDQNERFYEGQEIVEWLRERLADRSLRHLISQMNGCFTVLAANPQTGKVEVGVDRTAAVPVYIWVTPSRLAISDDFWAIAQAQDETSYNPLGLAGMLLLGHTTGPHTMLKDIQIPLPGSIYSYDLEEPIQSKRDQYWSNAFCPQPIQNYELLRAETAQMLKRVFNRHAQAIIDRGWTAEIALSGGIDSRLATGMLHQAGTPINAFSYGPPGENELLTAAEVSQALAIPFHKTIIDNPALFSQRVIEDQTRKIGAQSRFTTGIGVAVSYSAFDSKRVFITGHPGNLPTGQITERGSTLLRSSHQLAQYLLNNLGVPILDSTAQKILPTIWHPDLKYELYSSLPFLETDPIGSYEGWSYYYHVSNLLLMEMRVYEHFGHWLLPYLDYELTDFYNTVPLKYRYGRRLHIDAILSHLFVDDLTPLRDILISGTSRLNLPKIPLRDRLLMKTPPSLPGDLYLMRHTRSVQKARKGITSDAKKTAWGPDPLEFWWNQYPNFRNRVIDELRQWDGLDGMINVHGLLNALNQPVHPLFLRFVIATMLTLCAFQRITEEKKQLFTRPMKE